ncbi:MULTISPECIES: ArsR/SmtB family transcription factor [unclassified Mesorhizobium]|uniref:ArsR/SmtB family transcription factor n=1 Tax=unclassified Mesorhizobium TaxID=325217 RepID=UPI001CCD73D6|nr:MULTISPECIES: metalloregulator ArsR/SmtB family transcription factor [unclassified Mesorhizobium]MBZ9683508.1 metalloregulator ArsR/SmtB family transcription factor [Mesorhizobium sp. CO1-1-2]MBZ9698502.1 metalloregulator ArsR/SmtB family transcription factor [Mesorhizobium sp. CO1-1-9]MBZ9928123.1 metalloregulator ArsR/SmtB family transcription factor [Mesorhizobium sp. BR1-1-4]
MDSVERKAVLAQHSDHDIFRVISDPTRRAILDALRNGPLAVNTLANGFDQTRPGISKHLRVLREAGVVTETKHGRERRYQLTPSRLKPVDEWILTYRGFWQTQLGALKHYLETPNDDE